MEEDMPPAGLPKNLTHLSDSLMSSSFTWLGRGLQVLEGLRITTLSLDLMILATMWPSLPC